MLRQSETQVAQKSPRKPRWGRRGLALLAAVGVLSSLFCLPTSAAVEKDYHTYSIAFSRPTVTDEMGYVEVDYGGWAEIFLFYAPKPVSDYSVEKTYSYNVVYNYYPDLGKHVFYIQYHFSGSGVGVVEIPIYAYHVGSNGVFSSFSRPDSGSQDNTYFVNNRPPVGLHVYGCVNGYKTATAASDFIIQYGNEYSISEKLETIISMLRESGSNTEQAVDNANKKAEEREKQETQTSGDNASNDTTSAMPSVDAGFANSLKTFVGSMSYNGTEALLPIPKTSIPAMAGVTDEITLIAAQDYDLSAAINQYIPETLLQLIRHLFTIALVLYCVYELYGLIQYVLTLKKGGKDE